MSYLSDKGIEEFIKRERQATAECHEAPSEIKKKNR
jgi:hypothetical protein